MCATFSQHAESNLRKEDSALNALSGLLAILDAVSRANTAALVQNDVTVILPELFIFSTLVPAIYPSSTPDSQYRLAADILSRNLASLSEDVREHALAAVEQRLQDILLDTSVPVK